MKAQRKHELGLAELAIKAKDYVKAGRLLEDIASEQPDCHQAWFGLGEVAFRIEDFESALPLLEHAVNLNPQSAKYRKRLGEACCRVGLLPQGVEQLELARGLAPGDTEVACTLSGAYVAAGNWVGAKKVLDTVVGKGAQAGHYCLRGLAAQKLGMLDDAVKDFNKAKELDPGYADAWLALGDLYREKGELDKAARCAQKAWQLNPASAAGATICGDIELAKGDSRQAAHYFQKAIDLQPEAAESWAKLGIAFVESGESIKAIDALEKAHALGVSEEWVYEQMGVLFATRGQMEVALENLEKAVALHPESLNAWNTLIVVYTKLGMSDKGRQAAESVLALDPRHVNALLNLGGWYADQARNEEALEQYRKALAVNAKSTTAYTNSLWVLVHSSEVTAADVLALSRDFDRNLCLHHRRNNTFANKDKNPGRRLRIGWLTSDFRKHPVAAFVLPFMDKFDLSQVENIVYYNAHASDNVTALARQMVSGWRDVISIGDDALADVIEADQIDILVDLNGNSEGNRLLAVARKPAPIIVTWLGFPGTSGMSAVDYIFVPPDPVLEAGKWCSEKPWPLPDCYGVRANITDVPVLPGLPCERSGKPFTFGCLNSFRKASQETIRLWAEILNQVPDSRLLLVARGGTGGNMQTYIHEQFGRYGVEPHRLEIRGMQAPVHYFGSYNEIDFGLDPFPFNGGTTGFDSIWMGVPYVTWPGDMLVSRMGKAILENVGLGELVVDSAEAYVAKAVELAADREKLKRLRAGLRDRMLASPLLDSPRLARGLEDAFRGMWQRWCADQAAG